MIEIHGSRRTYRGGREVSNEIEALNGKRITGVSGCVNGSEEVTFICDDGSAFRMHHYQDCCESVRLIDVTGDADDLIGLVVGAREDSRDASAEVGESGTWTFYNIQTDRGCVTLRWLGESNGYYSEAVTFERVSL